MSVVAVQPSDSMPGGIIMAGPATVTEAPSFEKPYMFDLATREWAMSPIMLTLNPSILPSFSLSVNISKSA